MMTMKERVGFLLRAAERAEREGNLRVARVFRMMAADARPAAAFAPESEFAPEAAAG